MYRIPTKKAGVSRGLRTVLDGSELEWVGVQTETVRARLSVAWDHVSINQSAGCAGNLTNALYSAKKT